jgi:ankyrin repeat protein
MTEVTAATSGFEFPSIQDILEGTPQELIKAFTTLLRFGRFEALEPLVEGLCSQHQQALQQEKSSAQTKLQALLQGQDEGGHSLLHWAAKRGDDLRFLETLIELISEYSDLKSVVNNPRYVLV